MKKLLFLLTLIPSIVWSQAVVKGFTVTGKITGLADGEVKFTSPQDNAVLASGTSKGGVFTIKGSVTEPGLYFLVLNKEQPQYFFLENKNIKITGTKANIKNLKVEGSPAQTDFIAFNKIFNPIIGELNGAAAQINQTQNPEQRDVLMVRYDSVVQSLDKAVGNFITAHKSSPVSVFLLSVTAQILNNFTVMESRYTMLDEAMRNSPSGKGLGDFIAQSKIGAVGTDAIDFTQTDTAGQAVTLSSFKGKYVLVDFWASWCRPCRAENPNVVRTFEKFKNKNFTVLGVSLDQQKAAWTDAIKKDGLTWTHVSDLQQWSNAVAQLYHVQSIPQNMLIDPNGKIIAKDLRGPDLEKKLCELLGCN